MSKVSMKVDGLIGLQANLARAAAQARAAASKAVAEEVDAVKADAIEGAPHNTGELEAGIEGSSTGISGQVRSTARHAGFVEGGTYKDEAQPYMAPAAERSRKRFVGRVTLAVKTALEGIRA